MLKITPLWLLLMLLPLLVHAVDAKGLWNDVKEGASSAADSVSDAAESLTEEEPPAETRKKINAMAKSSLRRLFRENAGSRKLYNKSYGYAIFDTRKFSFMITSGFGAGVAVARKSGKRTYMKMATGGVNIGMGGEFFQLVILFEDKKSFDSFVNDGFEAGGEASAVAGKDVADVGARFINGMAVYELTDVGLKFAADFSGTKYWKDDDLN